jgi:nucleotide-binding universal stress UspA family protein
MASSPDPSTRRPYLAGYDGSPAAAAAVRFARLLASAGGDEVVVATVYRTIPRVLGGGSAAAGAALTEALREDAERMLEAVAGTGIRPEAVAGDSPAQGLHRLAEELGAALVAVGVTHRGAIGRLLVGGVGDRLLHGAPCPVAVVPAGWDGAAVASVGVAFDGRPESRAALLAGDALAARLGARLEVVGVYDPAPYLWLTSRDPAPHVWDVDELHAGFAEELQQAVDQLDSSVPRTVRTVSGLPGPALVEASHRGMDVLVTGSRGYGPVGGVLLGSVSRYVADHAACPLLVVPRTA